MIPRATLAGAATALAAAATMSATELYHLDFQPPEIGEYGISFGSPTVEPTVGTLEDALVFHAVKTYDQITLPVEVAAPVYHIAFNLMTHGLEDSEYAFVILLDTPQIYSIAFHGLHNAVDMINLGRVSPFLDDMVYHCEIVADFAADRFSLTIGGGRPNVTTIGQGPLESIHFSMAPWKYGAADDPGAYTALDNVVVTAVPEPSSASLLMSGLPILALRALRRKAPERTEDSPSC
jgi:hypothetical protein